MSIGRREVPVVRVGGTGFLGLLCLLFIGLKLGGLITWSWWFVMMPLWLPLAVALGMFIIMLIIAGIVGAVSK